MLESGSNRRRPRPCQQGRKANTTIFIEPVNAVNSGALASPQNGADAHFKVSGPGSTVTPQSGMLTVEKERAKVCSAWPSSCVPFIREQHRLPSASAAVSSPTLSRKLTITIPLFMPYNLLLLPLVVLLLLNSDCRGGCLGIVGVKAFNLSPQSATRPYTARPVLLYRTSHSSSSSSSSSSSIYIPSFCRPPARLSDGPLSRLMAGGQGEGDGGDDVVR